MAAQARQLRRADALSGERDVNLPEKAIELLKRQRTTAGDVDAMIAEAQHDVALTRDLIRHRVPDVMRILEIGCGVGLTSIMLERAFMPVQMVVVDGTGDVDDVGGYKAERRVWNDLDATRETIWKNQSKTTSIIVQDIWKPVVGKFDLVVSYLSWCFHYPASEWIDRVLPVLDQDALVAVDVRCGTGGLCQWLDASCSIRRDKKRMHTIYQQKKP